MLRVGIIKGYCMGLDETFRQNDIRGGRHPFGSSRAGESGAGLST